MPIPPDFLAAINEHSSGLVDAAEGNLAAPVEHCPGWRVADLVDHLRQVQWFWATIAEEQLAEPPDDARRPPRPKDGELLGALRAATTHLVDVLAVADPTTAVWTWAPARHDIAFIARHQVQEAAVHHFDTAHAAGLQFTMDPTLAIDAVEEFLTYSVATASDPAPELPALGAPLVLAATDAPARLTITDGDAPGTLIFSHGADEGAATLSASAAQLLLFCYQRVDLPAPRGGAALIDRFRALCYTD